MPLEPPIVVNLTRGSVVCDVTRVADRPWRRIAGLLLSGDLADGEGLLLAPSASVHTARKRGATDAVFLDGTLQVIKLVPGLAPWRVALVPRARSVLKLGAGQITRRELRAGDRLAVVDVTRPGSSAAVTGDGAQGSLKVLVAGYDRRFRAVATTLLVRRGCEVFVTDRMAMLAEIAQREAAQVVVVETGSVPALAAVQIRRLQALTQPVGAVAVGDQPGGDVASIPVLDKWGSFEVLFRAIELACPALG